MLPAFRLGIGGRIGSGRQFISWIAMDDLVGIIHHAIQSESLHGAVNAVSPNPVTNHTFSKVLGPSASRPAAFACRLSSPKWLSGKWPKKSFSRRPGAIIKAGESEI